MKKKLIMYAIVFLIFAFASCELFAPPEVEYYVDANADVSITISGEGESTEQYSINSSSLPWRKAFTAESGDFVYVSAQVQDYASWVNVKIEVDGDEYDSASSQGDFVIATASGTAD